MTVWRRWRTTAAASRSSTYKTRRSRCADTAPSRSTASDALLNTRTLASADRVCEWKKQYNAKALKVGVTLQWTKYIFHKYVYKGVDTLKWDNRTQEYLFFISSVISFVWYIDGVCLDFFLAQIRQFILYYRIIITHNDYGVSVWQNSSHVRLPDCPSK